jgi:acetylornithine deacetylase/succinyl-diaminopimelate desuccinylase-like protein
MRNIQDIINQVDVRRIADDLWKLVRIPSPTCRERQAALVFAQMLGQAGADVEVDETLYQSPNVIGRLRGNRPGKILQLAGHIDHIDVLHPEPARDEKIITGRGSADMKNGLAGILEIVRLLKHTGCDFAGEILVTVYGLHEAPTGDSKGLLSLIARGIKGDAAIVFEGPDDAAVIMAKGMSIWNINVTAQEPACHEQSSRSKGRELINTAMAIATILLDKDKEFQGENHTYRLLGSQSIFIGQFHYGDFYNRVPAKCTLQGTRRWHPNKTFRQIQDEFTSWLQSVRCSAGISIEHDWIFVGESYEISPEEPIVKSLCRGYKKVFDKELRISGHNSVNDTCRLVRMGHIPAVLCGFGTETGHADFEFVQVEQLGTACKVALYAGLDYLHSHEQ